jgi:hypothetical protein
MAEPASPQSGINQRLSEERKNRPRKQPNTVGGLFPKGSPACGIDWEHDPEFDAEPESDIRARAMEWQLSELFRIGGKECALLRRGTLNGEIKDRHLTGLRKAAETIAETYNELARRSKREAARRRLKVTLR